MRPAYRGCHITFFLQSPCSDTSERDLSRRGHPWRGLCLGEQPARTSPAGVALSIGQGVDDTWEVVDRLLQDLSVQCSDSPAPRRPGACHEGNDTLGALRSLVSRSVEFLGHVYLQWEGSRSRVSSARVPLSAGKSAPVERAGLSGEYRIV